jgi:hypothetical protein
VTDPDVWLLPDDGITDLIAIEVAARGVRQVRLTLRERLLAVEWMLAHGRPKWAVVQNLSLPNEHAATALIRRVQEGFTAAA